MNGNYYVNKLKAYFKQKRPFVWTFAVIFFFFNWDMAEHFFTLHKSVDDLIAPTFGNLNILGGIKRATQSPEFYLFLQIYYIIVSAIASYGFGGYIYEYFIKLKSYTLEGVKKEDIMVPKFPYDQDKLQLIVGLKHNEDSDELHERPNWIVVPEKGLYQDFMIIGGKGTGKTQSCMYPFTKQMVYYKAYEPAEKSGMLILDVKGNYTKTAIECATDVNRQDDVIVINLSGKYKFNPLHKPGLKTQVLANRLRTILELFSAQHADSYWLDKAEVLLNEAIKLVRLFNKGYVTFVEVHKVVNIDDYLNEKIEYLQELEDRNKLTREQKADFRTVKDYFLNEYKTLDTKISSVIKSEVTRMTYTFVSDSQILNTFCAPEDKLNFFGFDDLVDSGKIVVLDMNIAEYRNLAKIIAAYLKLDFQSAALMRLTREDANKIRPLIFVSDEYQEYVTVSDADFYAVSREAKCINIVATQSYSSLLKTIKSEESLQTILTNMTNKIWLRTDDKKTAEAAVAQCGVVDKEDVSRGFSDNAKLKYHNLMAKQTKEGTTVGQTYNVSIKTLEKFKITTFTLKLQTFRAIAYLSDGDRIMPPTFIHLEPYFKDIYKDLHSKAKPALKQSHKDDVIDIQDILDVKQDVVIEDNFDFNANMVIDKSKEDIDNISFDETNDKIDDDMFDQNEDEFGFDDNPKPKKKEVSKEKEFVPKYLDKEVEENLKDIDGIFDED